MRRYYTTAQRAAVIAMLFAIGCMATSAYTQNVWPGDINGNGTVNGIDLLYHGVAEGQVGPERFDQGTEWQAYSAGPQWVGSFNDGTNYSRADANGKGAVGYSDRKVLWEDNYGMTQSTHVLDNYPVANPLVDPTLQLVPTSTTVLPGEALQFDLFLGDAAKQVSNLYGITFKLQFDADWVKDETSAPMYDPNVVSISVDNAAWPAPTSGNELEPFIQLENDLGQVEMVILRELPESGSGHGLIASIMVIIEDVVMLENVETDFVINDIVLVDENLNRFPVAGSQTTVTIQANTSALQADENDDTATASMNAGVDMPEAMSLSVDQWAKDEIQGGDDIAQISVYPNPVVDRLQARTGSQTEMLESMKLFTADGQLLRQQLKIEATNTTMDVSTLPQGSYYVQLETNTGTTVKLINKQ